MPTHEPSRLARGLGTGIIVLAGLMVAFSLIRVGEALSAEEPTGLAARALVIGFGFVIVGAHGWLVRSGDARARKYVYAVVGPLVAGVLTPGGIVALALGIAGVVVSRKDARARQSAAAGPASV